MSCAVGEVVESLENELCYDYNYELCSYSNLSVTSPTSQLILQPFRRFNYCTSQLILQPFRCFTIRHSSFPNPSFDSPTSQALHLIHLASRPCFANVRRCEWPSTRKMNWNSRVSFWKQRQYDGPLAGQQASQGRDRHPSVCTLSIWITLYNIMYFKYLFHLNLFTAETILSKFTPSSVA